MTHQFIILGMHRSGTSLAAAVLHSMGISVGPPEMLMPAADANPKGFWERTDIVALNDEVLAACNACWDRIADFSLSALSADAEKRFHEQARAIVAALEPACPWLVKDPRFCLLMSLWHQAVPTPFCVLVSRNPLEVALSLRVRNRFPISYSLALWEQYMLSALRGMQGTPAIIISHARLLADPAGTVSALFTALQSSGANSLCMPASAEVEKIIDSNLYRQRCDDAQLQLFLNVRKENIPGPGRPVASWFLAAGRDSYLIARWKEKTLQLWENGEFADRTRYLWKHWNPDSGGALYFWFHGIFGELLHTDTAFADHFNRVPVIPADAPHAIQQHGMFNPPSERLKANSIMRTTPMYKLTHRVPAHASFDNTALGYLFGLHQH